MGRSRYAESRVVVNVQKLHATTAKAQTPTTARCHMLFQVVCSLPITFSTSLEGSVIEMKLTSPVPVNKVISLKAY